MCGIVGVIGMVGTKAINKAHVREDVFEQMLFADVFRGAHSTGVMMVDKKGECTYHKKAIASPDYLDLGSWTKYKKGFWDAQIVVGHNRHATTGSVVNANAHPFTHKHITLVHNGSLFSGWRAKLRVKNVDVDSHGIAVAIAEYGYKEALKTIDGGFALVWWDDREKTMNFVRNDQRPLGFVRIKDSPAILFASETPLARWIAWRNGLSVEATESLQEGELLSIHVDDLTKVKKEKVEFYEPPARSVWVNGTEYGHGYRSGGTAFDRELEAVGLKRNEKILFQILDTEASPGQSPNMTAIMGTPCFRNSFDVRCNYVANSVVNFDADEAVYEGLASSVSSAKGEGGSPVVMLTSVARHSMTEEELRTRQRRINKARAKKEKKGIDNVILLPEHNQLKGPQGHIVNIERMKHLTKDGCCWCSDPIPPEDYYRTEWLMGEPLCVDCAKKGAAGEIYGV